ncbi:DUF4276 family protein [bacterium]|nr:DUF4276 family protein [FCB group bacterium]MBL7190833.1 DUF4276 family protein [bacterium]
MHIDFFVEEISTEYFLESILPKILITDFSYKIHPYQGKQDLLKRLPYRLRGLNKWIPVDHKIFVLIDRDNDDCHQLKENFEEAALNTGLKTKSKPDENGQYQIINRIAIEELEAWYFGDIQALNSAYPRIDINLDKKAPYRDPDAIRGGTWEKLVRELRKKGYKEEITKTKLAQNVSVYMNPSRNSSHSFQVFRDGLISLVNQ